MENTWPGVLREDLRSPVRQWKHLERRGWQAESRAGVQEDNESMDSMEVTEKVKTVISTVAHTSNDHFLFI